MKVLLSVILTVNCWMVLVSSQKQQQTQPQTQTGRLLRIPRIYNALITTDEELLPSQAYPAVAPVLRPAIPHYGTLLVYNETDYGPPPPRSPYGPPSLPEGANPSPPQPKEDPLLYTLQAQQRPPDIFDDSVKNNRNPGIPDVPPPPLPVKPQQQPQQRTSKNEQGEPQQRRPQDYPPPPSVPFF